MCARTRNRVVNNQRRSQAADHGREGFCGLEPKVPDPNRQLEKPPEGPVGARGASVVSGPYLLGGVCNPEHRPPPTISRKEDAG